MRLSQSKRYQDDLKKFTNAINLIEDSNIKMKWSSVLSDFKNQVSIIDSIHSSYDPGKIDPSAARENVEKLAELRKKLDQLVKDTKLNQT